MNLIYKQCNCIFTHTPIIIVYVHLMNSKHMSCDSH